VKEIMKRKNVKRKIVEEKYVRFGAKKNGSKI